MKKVSLLFFIFFCYFQLNAQFVPVGSGSYRTTFPGTDVAGRNGYPGGTPQLTGNAVGKPVPTNDWWSKLLNQNHADNVYSYPFAMKTLNQGLAVSYVAFGIMDDLIPISVGTTNLNATKANVSDYSDWTVTMDWNDGTRHFDATAGIGMPFLYFSKGNSDIAQITVNSGTVTINNEMLIINKAKNGASFVVYAPQGSTWTKNDKIYTSTLNNKNYWSMCMLPLDATDITATANLYKKYAYVFPTDTKVKWAYDETTSVVRTDFEITTDVKEGTEKTMLIALLPHQWSHLVAGSPTFTNYKYKVAKGELKTIESNSFSVQNTYHGILPTLPYLNNYSQGFDPSRLTSKVDAIKNDALSTWTDSYNEGQVMNRLIQTARVANETGNIEARDIMLKTIKDRLQNWLSTQSGEVAFLFYYNTTWSTLLGYPAGHGQDTNINDHHFHWGYFIHAASFVEQFEPGWAQQWGEMINLLVRDAASPDRNDTLFPFLRNFSPYMGHCWANGFATFPQGNDQESTSESMQFNSSLIHWGEVTNNKAIRDLGIFLYTTEQTAIEEYWFDVNKRNFPATQQYSLVSRVWGNSFDNGTFWTNDIAASYGIELYPIHGGSLYLGHNIDYATKLWKEIGQNTGILSNQANDNLWHDIMWEYQAFTDPEAAIKLYDSYPSRNLKFGVSDAQTYYWLHSMNAMGQVDASITANYPIAAAFKKGTEITYVAHNYSDQPLTVKFSTGYELKVPARSMGNSKAVSIIGELASSFSQAYANGSVQLTVNVTEGAPTKVEFYDGSELIGTSNIAPFTLEAKHLQPRVHQFYARLYADEKYNVTNIASVTVGRQLPYNGTAWAIPGTIEAAKYDEYEGGIGQGISYNDASINNDGDFRENEYVDASLHATEGAIVTNISAGEWLEYTIDVESSGLYSLSCRYASGNAAGGGPFFFELDGKKVSDNISLSSTSSTSWDVWATKTASNIKLTKGKHILRLYFVDGEINIGKMTFQRTADLPYSQPLAVVGNNVKVLLPQTATILDGSASSEPSSKALTYKWEQVYGPSTITFSDNAAVSPSVSDLKEGIYLVRLTVTNTDSYSDFAEQYIIVTSTANILPTAFIASPAEGATYRENTAVTITARVDDIDGFVSKVEFYANGTLIGSSTTAPFSVSWTAPAGDYSLTAKATDNNGGVSTSQAVNVKRFTILSCGDTSKDASQGSFTDGYTYNFETVGTDVTFSIQLLDNKAGTIAYLWTQTPFSEKSMSEIGNKKFTTTIGGNAVGTPINVACKFAFAGGMSVTKYLTYKVGDNCSSAIGEELAQPQIIYYPSLVKDALHLQLPGNNSKLRVHDLSGRMMQSITINEQLHSLDMRNYKPGIYLFSVQYNNRIEYFKISKQ